ncbi:spermidine synthase [Novosphingobium piscinae]|uniref:Spermidine synthase n=1 Tax=Novosphingobium piscinae TaxID=1507448 RepID=A0A7X1FXF4_9SPHN|nr:spermidine synthase [Novosphingobium piscinae]MBC2668779.1 spermidine synthase [Novosphingobium piscinae]
MHSRSDEGEPIYLIDSAPLPEGGRLLLLRCGADFSIQLDDEELMGSMDHVSEEALATIVAGRLPDPDGPILIGGLGMGFTLGAALDAWGSETRVEVAELLPEVIAWAKGPLAHVFGETLADPRATVTLADVHDVIAGASDHYEAILLDVDNGPDGFIRDANDRLYCNWGIRSALKALRPGGMLAVWSAYPDEGFVARLGEAGFAVEEVVVPAYAGAKTDTHCIWLASKPLGAG